MARATNSFTFPTYTSDHMELNQNVTYGQVVMLTPGGSLLDNTDYDVSKVNMVIDINSQLLIFEQYADGYKESYPFKMIDDVSESDFRVSQQATIGNEFSDNFFKIKLKPSTVKTISAGSAIDRNQWIRVLLLIIQINRLSLNGVNPFIVEHFQKK